MSKLADVLEKDIARDHRFGSDYYVRQASVPSGARGTSQAEENSSFIFHNSTSPSIEDHEEKYSNEFVPAFEQNSEDIYVATPVKVEDIDYMNSTIHDDYSKPEISEEENADNIDITSDSDLSQINYYDVIESKVYAKFSNVDSPVVKNETETQDRDVELKINNLINRHEVSVPVAKPRNKIVIKTNDKEIENTRDYVATTDEVTKNYVPDTKYNSERIKVPTPSFSSTPFIIQKRSDNTLIKKIYANVNVRSFALNNRSTLPGTIDLSETEIKANEQTFGHHSRRKNIKIVDAKPKYPQESLPSPQLVLPNIYLDDEKVKSFANLESNGSEVVHSDIKLDPPMKRDKRIGENEISELKAQGLVANRLRQLSKSMTNLTSLSSNKWHKQESLETTQNQCFTFSDDDFELNPRFNSVKYLRQRFEQQRIESVAEKPIYSLTGRSISNQFKEKLRRMDNGFSIESEVHSLSLTNMDFDDKDAESRYEKTK